MSLPDWPSLWEREPGLRPERLTHGDTGFVTDFLGPDRVICLEHAAALCRDVAVRWLLTQNVNWLAICRWTDMSFSIGQTGEDGVEGFAGDIFESDTFDSALFAACEAVLNARPVSHR